ncbi:MAG: endonuclease III [Alphaproteobacteria bacterium]|nr:endonuclease III [Alphaproteobacteria bacterium]
MAKASSPDRSSTLSAAAIEAIFSHFSAANPHPKTELLAPNPYCLLVAIVLSAQATDVGVNKATPRLFERASSPKAMCALGEDGLKKYIKTIGLFNTKARNILALSVRLMEAYGGEVPTTRAALETLPGVGRKTANVWLNCVLGLPTIGVDTHVLRVANRLGLCTTTTPLATELALEKTIPDRWKKHAHHWLILHGRYVCKARTPECARCGVARWCAYPAKTGARE